ncbi:flavodoxin [Saccharopolyspora subtropica]|uniref:Flavodoxin n=1 Tax=Saccharopolyspora thermophila TaxID=89367 RepID=A0A917JYY4_9PSEU|nr:flavodoxin family protein [Saccharopolyspora subtropica]GGI90638.1 flavodoxin [Saccharopolyspora subtropica]
MGGNTHEQGEADTMRALVVYRTTHGSARTIAEHIAAGLARRMPVDLADVTNAPSCTAGVDLLVVGTDPGHHDDLHHWLNTLHKGPGPVRAATFDTRADTNPSAARTVEHHLRSTGFHLTEPTRSFHLRRPGGPLRSGETDRARRWAEHLAAGLPALTR